ncbi:MAG: ferric reductase, partial [Rhodobacteraceae bacterium]|nr:ferric reductase [Paracoccaceae bacterium]
AGVAALRRRFRGRLPLWRRVHTALAAVVVVASVVHAMLVVGTMETISKILLCAVILVVAGKVIADRRGWTARVRRTP